MAVTSGLMVLVYLIGVDQGKQSKGHWVKSTKTVEVWEFKGDNP